MVSRNQNFGVVFAAERDIFKLMRGEKALILFLICGVLCASAAEPASAAADNPYRGIVERNVFNLRPPPPPRTNAPPKAPPPKITLNGITTIFGDKRALFTVDERPKPGQKPEQKSCILTEGQRDGGVEVLAIDETAGTVKVNNHGTVQVLDFENNGAKIPTGPITLPGLMANSPGGGIPRPGVVTANPNTPRIPTRTLRLPPPVPPRTQPGVATSQNLTPEQRAALMEAQREAARNVRRPAVRLQSR